MAQPSNLDTSEYVKTSIDVAELHQVKFAALEGRPYADRISFAFAVRLIQALNQGQGYYNIIDELDCLEGLRADSNTKSAEPFIGPTLRPLWHKHFIAPRHFLKNIGIRWALDRHGNRDLNRLLADIAKRGPDNWIGVLYHKLVFDGYWARAREKRLTGDWIIFGKYEGQNYYLDLATHEEGKDEKRLMEKLRYGCEAEFPFFFG